MSSWCRLQAARVTEDPQQPDRNYGEVYLFADPWRPRVAETVTSSTMTGTQFTC